METKTKLNITPRVLEQDGIALLSLQGYIDSTTALLLKNEIERLGRRIFRFIIDFGGVEYVSSAGWGVILTRIREFRAKEGDIIFVEMSDEVQSVFQLLELNQVIKQFPSVEDGLKHLGVKTPVTLADFVDLSSSEQDSLKNEKLSIADAVRMIVCENPLLTAAQIKKQLLTPVYGFKKLNTLKVYLLLRRLGLHTKERRLYYAWKSLVKKKREHDL